MSRQSNKIKFQFQYGAIKGLSVIERIRVLFTFQFQYGAIKGTDLS